MNSELENYVKEFALPEFHLALKVVNQAFQGESDGPCMATFSFSADVAHGQEVHCGIESLQHGTPTILQTLDGKGFSYGDCGRSHVEEKVKEKKEIEVRHRRRCNTVPTDLRHDHSLS